MNQDKEANSVPVEKKRASLIRRILKWFGYFTLGLALLFVALIFALRTPVVQQWITNKATLYVSELTGADCSINRLYLTFSGNLWLEGVYLSDLEGDTLFYFSSLETGLRIRPLIDREIRVRKFDWRGLRANVLTDSLGVNNYDFLIEAFSSGGKEREVESEPLSIYLPRINVADIQISITDRQAGMDLELFLENISLSPLQLSTLFENIEQEAISISGLKVNMLLYESAVGVSEAPISIDQEKSEGLTSLLPIKLGQLSIDDLNFTLRDRKLDSDLTVSLDRYLMSEFHLRPFENSSGLPKIIVGELLTESLRIHYADSPNFPGGIPKPTGDEEGIEFEFQWPGILVETGKISFVDSDFHYFKKGVFALPGEFNPENIRINSPIFELANITLGEDQASIDGFHLKASEQSGLSLENFGFDISLANDALQIRNIDLRTGHSSLESEIYLTFNQIDQMVNEPGEITVDVQLRDLNLGPGDLALLQPQLIYDPTLGPFLKHPIHLKSRFRGKLDQLDIAHFDLRMGTDSRLELNGRIRELMDFERLSYSLASVSLKIPEIDMAHLIALDSPFVMPSFILVKGSVEGNSKLVKTGLEIAVPHGRLSLNGQFSDFGDQMEYNARMTIEELNTAFYSDSLGPESISGTLEVAGQGLDPDHLHASFIAEFLDLQYKGVRYSPLYLEGSWAEKRGMLRVSLDGELLAFDFTGSGSLDTTAYELTATMDITHLDAFSYDLFEDSTTFKSKVFIEASGNEGIFSGFLRIDSLIAFQQEGQYTLDSLEADLFFDPSTTFFDVRSAILRSNLSVNTSPDKVVDGLMAHIRSYGDPSMSDSMVIKGLEADFQLEIPETRFLKEVIAPELEEMETIRAQVFYRESSRNILMQLDAPHINYGGVEVKELMLRADSNRDSLQFETGFDNLQSGGIDVQKTRLHGLFKDSTLLMTLNMVAEETQIALLHLRVKMEADTFQFHLRPDELIFNDEIWGIDENNLITYATNFLKIEDFNLRRQDNFFSLKSHPLGRGNFLGIEFSNLSLGGLLDFVNPVEDYADAILNGKIELDNIFEQPELLLNINAEDLVAMDIALGKMIANLESRDMETFVLEIELTDGDLNLLADGELNISDPDLPQYRGNVVLERLEFSMLENFTAGAIRNSKGVISGQFSTSGAGMDIEYTGFLRIDSVAFVVTEVGTSFTIPSERIDFSQSDIVFTDFTIRDGRGNPTVISGAVDITNPINPGFGLNISSRNFRFLESTRADNDFVYGKAIADLDIRIEGDLSQPNMQLEVDLKRGTEITMIVPESQVDIEDREGVIRIERRIEGQVVREEEVEEVSPPLFTGLDLQAVIHLDPSVIFRIVLDERAGDQLEVAGRADLSFDMDREGRMSLSGIYELSRGFYEMRMYDIVRRRFELQPGSRLSWFGDPMEAEMSITAVYRIRTSALDLMADQLVGADQATRTQFRQELPFEVVMDISGELLRPILEFSLDMPEIARGAHGGNVYSRIQQLNTTESELNTQVFSLLVLNRFLPSGVASEEGQLFDAGAMARSSASSILSGQLNALSDRYIRGVDLDFDLESFTDYQSGRAEDRTQLNVRMRRSLVGDRLTLEVGGQIDLEGSEAADRQSATDILGDVNIEYSLTEDGTWRIRGFRRNQYEGVLEGQVIATGISLLFNRDFNTFAELFQNRRAREGNDQ
ncbi:MAG: translocation/assembly module TamB [Saprospirales bacterium]|nr:MAG: translocation/assembly module TamB [Saprospirales bacterium]